MNNFYAAERTRLTVGSESTDRDAEDRTYGDRPNAEKNRDPLNCGLSLVAQPDAQADEENLGSNGALVFSLGPDSRQAVARGSDAALANFRGQLTNDEVVQGGGKDGSAKGICSYEMRSEIEAANLHRSEMSRFIRNFERRLNEAKRENKNTI